MLKAVVRRNDFATAEAPNGAMLLLFASEVCCAVVVRRWTVVLVYARGTYALSKSTNACCRHGKKKVSVIPNLLHEGHSWRVMYCKSKVMNK